MMNGFDAAIILILIMGAVVGFKRGFTYEVVSAIGFFLVLVLAYFLKNPLSVFLYEHLPFFKFGGIFKGVTVLNIFLYEVIAFLIVAIILMFILKIVAKVTNLFEKFLKFTFIFSIPSKIAGMIVGVIESYVWVYIILYILNLPMFDIPLLQKSNYKDQILNHTVILSNATDHSMKVINEFLELKDKYEVTPNATEFNRETLDLFLKYDVITVDSVETLRDRDKLKIDNLDEILNKYKEE